MSSTTQTTGIPTGHLEPRPGPLSIGFAVAAA